jgi:hypothetical protein
MMLEELTARRLKKQLRNGEPWVTDYAGGSALCEDITRYICEKF